MMDPPCGADHVGHRVPGAQEGAAHVEGDGPVEFVHVHAQQVQVLARVRSADVVAQDVQVAEFADGGGDHVGDRALVGDVHGDRQRPAARGLDERGGLLGTPGVVVGDHDPGAFPAHQFGGGPPDTAARTGDDRDLALEAFHGPVLSSA